MFKSLLHRSTLLNPQGVATSSRFSSLIVSRLVEKQNSNNLLLCKQDSSIGNEFSQSIFNSSSPSSYSKQNHGHENCSSISNHQQVEEEEEVAPIIKIQQKLTQQQATSNTTPASNQKTTSSSSSNNIASQIMFDSVDISKTSNEEFQTIMITLRNHLKTINPEQYSIALLQKDEIQVNILTILFCLNAELATIKDFTKTPSTGLLRLSWWKDQVKNALAGLPPRVPVLMALSYMQYNYFKKGFTLSGEVNTNNINTVNSNTGNSNSGNTSNGGLKFSHLRNIFKWREVDLKWKQPTTLSDIESYSEGVYSTLIMSHLQCSKYRDVHTDHVASHLGRSYGICTLLRSVPHLSEHQSTYLPAQLCAKYGITEDDIYKHQNSHEMEEVVFKVADLAKSHLDLARELADLKDEKTGKLLVNSNAYPLFMTSIVCEVFLEKLEKVNFNIFHPSIGAQQLRFSILFRLGKTSWFGKY